MAWNCITLTTTSAQLKAKQRKPVSLKNVLDETVEIIHLIKSQPFLILCETNGMCAYSTFAAFLSRRAVSHIVGKAYGEYRRKPRSQGSRTYSANNLCQGNKY